MIEKIEMLKDEIRHHPNLRLVKFSNYNLHSFTLFYDINKCTLHRSIYKYGTYVKHYTIYELKILTEAINDKLIIPIKYTGKCLIFEPSLELQFMLL